MKRGENKREDGERGRGEGVRSRGSEEAREDRGVV